jgi:hypothetical protein
LSASARGFGGGGHGGGFARIGGGFGHHHGDWRGRGGYYRYGGLRPCRRACPGDIRPPPNSSSESPLTRGAR